MQYSIFETTLAFLANKSGRTSKNGYHEYGAVFDDWAEPTLRDRNKDN